MNEPVVAHKNEFEKLPDIVVSVPQATTIIGTFSDCVKGWSLVCNIEDGITLTLSKRDDNIVRVVNAAKQDKKKFIISSIKYRREDKWANAVKAVFYEVLKLKTKTPGFNILISGRGASSASYSLSAELYVGVAVALNSLLSLKLNSDDLFSLIVRASKFSITNKARYRDLWVLFYGKENMVYLCDEKKNEMKEARYSFPQSLSFIFDSALPYSVLTPEYEEFRLSIPGLIDSLMLSFPRGTEFRDLSEREIRYYTSSIQDYERRGLLFLNCSSSYARIAFDWIGRSDWSSFGKTLFAAQRSLMTNAELTSPELDWIFRRSKESLSVVGMASIDVGSAGSFICLVDSQYEFPDNQKLDEYEKIFGFHPSKTAFRPCSSARIVKVDD